MKGQMFIVTVIFLVGMITIIQQSLFSYSAIDLSSPLRSNDYYILNNLKDAINDSAENVTRCEFGKVDSLEYTISELKSFINFQKPKEGFTYSMEFDTNCTHWHSSTPVLNASVNIFGRSVETQGIFMITK